MTEEGEKVIEPVCVGEWLSFAAFLPGQWWVSNMEVLSLVAKVVARSGSAGLEAGAGGSAKQ